MLTAHTAIVAYPMAVPLATTLQPDSKRLWKRLLTEHLGCDMKGFSSPKAQSAHDVIISKQRTVWFGG